MAVAFLLFVFAYAALERVAGPSTGALVVVPVVVAVVVGAVVGYLHDTRRQVLDDRGRLAAAAAKREEDVQLLAREITNPLISIETAARVLAGQDLGTLDPHATAVLISREARTALDLVRSLTEAAQIEGRGLHLEQHPLDLVALARETLARFDAADRHIALSAPEAAVRVMGDRVALQRVLRQLLSNAVLYSREGTIVLSLSLSPDGRGVTLAVRDGGPPIPPEERPLLFRKFARLSTAGGTSGAGLSLWVSQAILEEHGTVLEASWPGRGGNDFSFTLRTL